MSEQNLELDDLVRATGFSKRQIRYYITRGLVPGSGDSRGPYAVYPPETLERLRRIAELKKRRVGPTDRRLTLAEIQHELGPILLSTSVERRRPARAGHARRIELDSIREDDRFLPQISAFAGPRRPARDPLRDLLGQLAEGLNRLAHAPAVEPRDGTGRWLRIPATREAPLEINVQHPTHPDDHERLEALARSLYALLNPEDPS